MLCMVGWFMRKRLFGPLSIPWFALVCIMVLVTLRFIGLAHLHSLWGCLAFVGFPSGFGLVCLGLCPLVFLCPVLVGFSLAACTFGVVWAPWPPDAMESFVPVGLLPWVFMACFCGGLLRLLLWLPPRSALSILGQFRSKFTHLSTVNLYFAREQFHWGRDFGGSPKVLWLNKFSGDGPGPWLRNFSEESKENRERHHSGWQRKKNAVFAAGLPCTKQPTCQKMMVLRLRFSRSPRFRIFEPNYMPSILKWVHLVSMNDLPDLWPEDHYRISKLPTTLRSANSMTSANITVYVQCSNRKWFSRSSTQWSTNP